MEFDQNKITLKETPETDEALNALNRAKKENQPAQWGVFISFGFLEGLAIGIFKWNLLLGVGLLCLAIFLEIVIYMAIDKKIKPYRELLKQAEKNDQIRYEEKIRFSERQRLVQEQNQFQQIDLIQQQRDLMRKKMIVERETKDIKEDK